MIHVGIWNRTSGHLILADWTISVAVIVSKVIRYVHCICFVILYGLIFFVISPDDCMHTPMSVLRNWGEITLGYNKEFAICRVANNFFSLFRMPEYFGNVVANLSVCAFQPTCSSRATPKKSNLSTLSISFWFIFKTGTRFDTSFWYEWYGINFVFLILRDNLFKNSHS